MEISKYDSSSDIQRVTLADLMKTLGRPTSKTELRTLDNELVACRLGWSRQGAYSLTIELDRQGLWQAMFFCELPIGRNGTIRRERLVDGTTEMLEAWITLNANYFIENINR